MGKMNELVKKIEDANKNEEESNFYDEKSLIEWIGNINKIFGKIKIWITPLIVKNLVSIKENKNIHIEEISGSYDAPVLSIHGKNWTMHLKPVGRYVVGAQGRIDIACGPKSAMLLLHKDGWKLAEKKDRGFDYKELDEELFADIIEEMTL